MLAYIQFRRKDGSWGIILRKNLSLLFRRIEKGEVDAVNAETLTVQEVGLIRNKGFDLIPEDIVRAQRSIKILRIERS